MRRNPSRQRRASPPCSMAASEPAISRQSGRRWDPSSRGLVIKSRVALVAPVRIQLTGDGKFVVHPTWLNDSSLFLICLRMAFKNGHRNRVICKASPAGPGGGLCESKEKTVLAIACTERSPQPCGPNKQCARLGGSDLTINHGLPRNALGW